MMLGVNMQCHSKHNQFGSKRNQCGTECNHYCNVSSRKRYDSKNDDCNVLSSNICRSYDNYILSAKIGNTFELFFRDSKSILEQFCLNCVLFYAYFAPWPSQLCFGKCICGTQRYCIVKWRFCELSQTAI